MRISGREEMREVWTENISRGGLFVTTETPPELRTRLEVQLETPDGKVVLQADVVHVLDAASSSSMGMPAGVGLQFVDLTPRQRAAIDRYVDGVASRLKTETDDLPATPGSEIVTTVMTIFSGVEGGDLYEALGLPGSSAEEEIHERLQDFRTRLDASLKTLTPAQQIRVTNAKKMLARIGRVLGDPGRRLEYDIRTQQVKVETLLQAKDGLEIRKMREQWRQSFPERVERAKHRATEAVQYFEAKEYDHAIAAAEEALALDPLNRDLRSAIKDWKKNARPDKGKAAPSATKPPETSTT